ncbi:MAG: TIGR04190 family B12-binding domain/radical SAM domain protein [Deltaproteobacteria bacterium]|nr:TIGR04190 family B12-binding domain/radical SAM domain protein [Deltaproteobacteria bacterium]
MRTDVDLLLLHAPSVYDFRRRSILYGPVSDLIPSSPVFEMYPLGFVTMASYLAERGFTVRIVNLALRMMNDRRFDVPQFLARLKPGAVGIDLHWLPHAHGSLEIARIVKELHPNVPVIFGGLSSTYFHEELIRYPQVDYVLRGDSVEPALSELLRVLAAGVLPDRVPNLTWKANGEVRVNPLGSLPESLDYVDLRVDRMVEMVLRYRDLESVLPFNGWWGNPITAVFTAKGCAHECVTCGSSHTTCGLLTTRRHPVFRSPASLVANMVDISRLTRGPIFIVGDLRQNGDDYAHEALERLSRAAIGNEIVFELFDNPPREYLEAIDRAVRNWSLEISPESHDERIRRLQDETTFFTNAEMEATIDAALGLRSHRLDVFFMIGLPGQTRESVRETVRYCQRLFERSDRRLSCFISPMGPFLDPGSRGFEEPERFGYRLLARTLEEHRQLLLQPSWEHILNYETRWMTRRDLVEATYEAAETLNALKLRYGRIDRARGEGVARRIAAARALKNRLDDQGRRGVIDKEVARTLEGEVRAFSVSTVCDKRELFWEGHVMNFRLLTILRIALRYLGRQVRSSTLLNRARIAAGFNWWRRAKKA